MRWLRRVYLLLFRKEQVESRLDQELRSYLDLLIDERIAAGQSPVEARRQALIELEGVEQVKEKVREVRMGVFIESLLKDLRHALRMGAREKGLVFAAVLVLALGIGASSTVFSLADAVVLRPLAFPDAGRLYQIAEITPRKFPNSVAALNFLNWREQSKSFEQMAASGPGSAILKIADAPERVIGQAVSAGFFDVLGVKAYLGELFTSADEKPGSARKVIFSYSFWLRRFGGDRSLIGRPLVLNDQPYTVTGILPEGFALYGNDIWTPLALSPATANRRGHFLRVIGRLRRGVTQTEALTEMHLIASRIAGEAPDTNHGWSAGITPLRDVLVGSDLKSTSLMLLAAVGLIMLIACVDVANLLLARRVARSREMVVRSSLGAGRSRLIRQALTESILLALLGGAFGIWITWGAVEVLPHILPPGIIPPAIKLQLDARVTLFALTVSVLTALLFGILPAWQISGVNLGLSLREGGRTSTGGRRTLAILASVEIALAIVVLAGAGLLVRTLLSLESVGRGYRDENVLAMRIAPPPASTNTPQKATALFQAIEQSLRSVRGVQSVGIATELPLEGWSFGAFFQALGVSSDPSGNRNGAHLQSANPAYFATLGIPLLAGRPFNDQDTVQSATVCIVNEALAKNHLGGRDPIGSRLDLGSSNGKPNICEVVGVAGQVKVQGPGEPPALEIYVPLAQNPPSVVSIALKTAGDPMTAAKPASAAIQQIASIPILQTLPLEALAAKSVARPRMRVQIALTFGGLAALLACIGISGVLSYGVSQRVREIGVRVALGATSSRVVGLVLREGVSITLAGIVAGLLAAALLTRYMSTLLWGVEALDPMTFIAAPALFAIVSLLACAIPARRASQVDPAVALRDD